MPAARYNAIDDLFGDPHLADVGFFGSEEHPTEGRIRRTRIPNTFSGGMREDGSPAPRLGEHTRSVLAEIGYPDGEIDRLVAMGGAQTAD
jgi:crotonobetainyl-CoA:carnitine CoA-transferase CaiB-like acyl-CoA transferase